VVVVAGATVEAVGTVVVVTEPDVVVVSGATVVGGVVAGSCPVSLQAATNNTPAMSPTMSVVRIVDQGKADFSLWEMVLGRDVAQCVVLSIMDDNEFNDIQENLEPARTTDREGIPWGAAFLLVWAVILIVFAVQNADDTSVQFLGWTWVMPVAMLVMVTALITLVLTGLGASFYRRRRRKRRELKRAAGSDD